MKARPPSAFPDAAAFAARLAEIDPDLGCDPAIEGAGGPLGAPLDLGFATIGNRICVHPMEGWDGTRDGLPSPHTLRRWRRFGESGAKLIWGGEAFAVNPDGRANPNQLCLHPDGDAAGGLRALLRELKDGHRAAGHDEGGLVVGLQLTHSGRFARPDRPRPRVAFRHPVLDERFGVDESCVLADAELDAIQRDFVRAARVAADVGFDFVDVKCCHGYLLHEMLAARRRPGRFGGDLDGRTAFLAGVLAAIRSECPRLGIGVRLSLSDVFPFRAAKDGVGAPVGIESHLPYDCAFGVDRDDPLKPDFREPMELLAKLRAWGVAAVNVTLGSPYWCPHLQRPAAYPPSDGYLPPEDPLVFVAAHLRAAREAKRSGLAVVGSGYSYLQEWCGHVAQRELRLGRVDAVGFGRMMLSYPELPRDLLARRPLDRKKICRTFSDCTTAPRNGLISGCFPLDDFYKNRPEAQTLAELKQADK